MKKLSYLFLLLVGIWLAGCDDSSEASLIPEIIPTEQGSDTYVMKGYESSDNGFNVYKPKAIGTPFYIQSKAFTGRNYAFAPVNSESLEGLTVVPSADAFSESVEVKPSTCYWVRFNRYNHYQMGKLRVAYIHGNEVGIEYVASEDIDVKMPILLITIKQTILKSQLSMQPINILNTMQACLMRKVPGRYSISLWNTSLPRSIRLGWHSVSTRLLRKTT